jgi:hypothetical protein
MGYIWEVAWYRRRESRGAQRITKAYILWIHMLLCLNKCNIDSVKNEAKSLNEVPCVEITGDSVQIEAKEYYDFFDTTCR